MTPSEFAVQLRSETDKSKRVQMLVDYFAEHYQWVEMRDGLVRWGWFLPPFPRELALIALDRAD